MNNKDGKKKVYVVDDNEESYYNIIYYNIIQYNIKYQPIIASHVIFKISIVIIN